MIVVLNKNKIFNDYPSMSALAQELGYVKQEITQLQNPNRKFFRKNSDAWKLFCTLKEMGYAEIVENETKEKQ
jgi:hypothetical protein